MRLEKENYTLFNHLEKYGVRILNTKINYGNIIKKKNSEIISDFNLGDRKIISGFQVHSDNIEIISDIKNDFFEKTDGFITKNKNVALLTKFADCMPIILYDTKNEILSSVHSGWKGSFQEIGLKAIKLMQNNFDSELKNILIIFGIAITPENYEVQLDFKESFLKKFDQNIVNHAFLEKNGKILFDNQAFNYNLFKNFGVSEENIFLNNLCTFLGDYHSYRRDRELSGRNGVLAYFL